jgi:hypothetical protein
VTALSISTKHHACLNGAPAHLIEFGTRHCSLCRKSHDELACPACEPVYSSNVEVIDGVVHRLWICRVCLHNGADPMPDAQEYQVLKGGLAEFKSGPIGGPVLDSPRPSLRVEYPGSFVSENFRSR